MESIFTTEDFLLQGYDKHIRQARNTIFVAAGLLSLSVIILCFTIADGYEFLRIDISIYALFIAGFIALGFGQKNGPAMLLLGR